MSELTSTFSEALGMMRHSLGRGIPTRIGPHLEIGMPKAALDELFAAFLHEHPGLAQANREPGSEFRYDGVRLYAIDR